MLAGEIAFVYLVSMFYWQKHHLWVQLHNYTAIEKFHLAKEVNFQLWKILYSFRMCVFFENML